MTEICPPLVGEKVRLLPLLPSHAKALFPILSDAELWRFIESGPPASLASLRGRYKRLAKRVGPDGALWLNWVVERRADDRIVGYVQATVRATDAEIAYMLGRSFWRRGLALDSTTAMIEFLHHALYVRTLRATVDVRNVASVRLLERLGFDLIYNDDSNSVLYGRELGGN